MPWQIFVPTEGSYLDHCKAPRDVAVTMREQTRARAAGSTIHRVIIQVLTPEGGIHWPAQDDRKVGAYARGLMWSRQRPMSLWGDSHIWRCTLKLKD